ncbi:MAG: tetratricopeptide repeat protein [Microcoleus vaginatus WJT46-NPBG5]|nr:tetratricopeptide repeat protein [Microcoleus vaginatus WJT46-NPBG5]
MSYCINPKCICRHNPDNLAHCQSCGTPLLINNRYRLIKPLRELDEFCPTEVFEVEDGDKLKVMKVLKRPKWSQMFQREARVLQQLRHPGIPQVEPDGYFILKLDQISKELHCVVMEKIEGQNLEQWVEKYGRISQKIALDWLRQLTKILQIVHEKDLFHRDLKPSNIMVRCPLGGLEGGSELVLIDFGTVREVTGTYLAKVGSHQQITGIVSPGYTPPEQAGGKAVPQSDFFALGRTFVHLLTEKHPVELPENPETGELIWRDCAPHISSHLADLIDELMATFPGRRPANAQLILDRLEMVKNNRGGWVKPPRWLAAVMLILVGVTGFWGVRVALAVYYYNRGLENHLASQSDEAEADYKQALKYNQNSAKVYNALGFLCQNRQDWECARTQYEKAITLQPNLAIAQFNLATLCEDRQDWNCARTAYQKASQNGLSAADNNLARLYILEGQYEPAVQLLSQSLKQANDNTKKYAILKNLGWALFGQKRYQQAQEKLQEAIALDRHRAPAYCLLAQVLESQNQWKAAQVEWQNCLRYASRFNLDEAIWIDMARARLNSAAEEK